MAVLALAVAASIQVSTPAAGGTVTVPTAVGLDEAEIVNQLSSARTTTVLEPDGSYSSRVYASPVNFRDAYGSWAPIDNTLVDAPGASYELQNAANSFSAMIPEDPSTTPIRFQERSQWVTMRLRGAEDDAPSVSGDTVTYDQVPGADSVTYQVTDAGLKETLTLEEPPAEESTFVYTIDASPGLTPALMPDSSIEFADDAGNVAFRIPAGVMQDSRAPEPAKSSGVTYVITPERTKWKLTVKPDMAWLLDPDRVYPVAVDPSLTEPTGFARLLDHAD